MTRALALLVMMTATACSSISTPAPYVPPSGDKVVEQVNGSCASPSSVLKGTVAAGGACTEGADCAPVCCPCNNGTNREWLGVHCSSKVCVGAPDVCTDTINVDPTVCKNP